MSSGTPHTVPQKISFIYVLNSFFFGIVGCTFWGLHTLTILNYSKQPSSLKAGAIADM